MVDPEKEKEDRIKLNEKLEKEKKRGTRRTGGGMVRTISCTMVSLSLTDPCVHMLLSGWWPHDS